MLKDGGMQACSLQATAAKSQRCVGCQWLTLVATAALARSWLHVTPLALCTSGLL